MDIEQEYNNLQGQQKRLSIFKKKSESLSRLKLSFFEKMKKAEDSEDVQAAKQYYSYLIRTMKLSSTIYNKMELEIQTYSQHYSHQSFSSYELQQQLGTCKTPAFQNFKEQFFSFHATLGRYQNALSSFFTDITKEGSPIYEIKTLIHKENELFADLEDYHSDFFKKIDDQKQIHNLLLEEKKISDGFIQRIEKLERETTTFAQQIVNQTQQTQQAIKSLVREMSQNPKQAAIYPFQQLAHVFEKHASIVATTVIGLGLAANLSTLAGVGSIAVVAQSVMGILSHTLEGVEAFPTLKDIVSKGNHLISRTINSVQHSIHNVFSSQAP